MTVLFLLSLLKIRLIYCLGYQWIFDITKISNTSLFHGWPPHICSLQVTIFDHHLKVIMKILRCFDLQSFKDFLTCCKCDIDVIHEDDTVTCLEVQQLL